MDKQASDLLANSGCGRHWLSIDASRNLLYLRGRQRAFVVHRCPPSSTVAAILLWLIESIAQGANWRRMMVLPSSCVRWWKAKNPRNFSDFYPGARRSYIAPLYNQVKPRIDELGGGTRAAQYLFFGTWKVPRNLSGFYWRIRRS